MKAVVVAVLTGAVVGAAIGCNGDNSLGGSMSEVFPLAVSRVEIVRNDVAFQVSYYNNNGNSLDLVARVTLALDGLNFKPGDFPLQGRGRRRSALLGVAPGGWLASAATARRAPR